MTNRPAKSFSITVNNPVPQFQQWMDEGWARTDNPFKFLKIYPETGESGTDHFQGAARTKKTNRPTAVAAWLRENVQSAHVESTVGTWAQMMDYISKDGGDPIQWGEAPPLTKDTNPFQKIKKLVDDDPPNLIDLLYEQHTTQMFRCYNGISRYITHARPRDTREVKVIWLFGPTGSGKTYSLPTGKDVYWKPPGNRWFDGYAGESIVVLDEFRKNFWTFSYMLSLLDKYPLQVEIKGGFVPFRANVIYITAPQHPRMMYCTREDVGQLTRRIDHIYECNKTVDGTYTKCEVADDPNMNIFEFNYENEVGDIQAYEYGTSYDN